MAIKTLETTLLGSKEDDNAKEIDQENEDANKFNLLDDLEMGFEKLKILILRQKNKKLNICPLGIRHQT